MGCVLTTAASHDVEAIVLAGFARFEVVFGLAAVRHEQ